MTGAFTVPVEGATLAGERSGKGLPLVLLHGMAGERQDWNRLLATLPADMTTLRYDLRGFGQSPSDDREYSHTDDLLALFDAQAIERAPLLGLSMGGGVALNFALSHPERVSRLVLISPAIVGWEWSDEWKALWRSVSRAARDGDMALARERWWQHPMFELARQSEAADELRHAIDAYHGRQWIRDPQRDELPDVDRLHTLAMPLLLLTGEHDVADIRLIADVIEAAAPDVRRIDYAGAGHMLHLERAAGVAAEITSLTR
ncbi:alpha/beta fold hydrolase [Novosphingobium sp. G106]|uniref:alpha/beta fold hydrolase n=1 Tax=Novosphingobium sp. G106 TaxID=2849500 RepID=UPI001C2CE9B9|nr:alpha/beta fold hydrolase [Novosphingobium sp. G106]MBV1688301.1 alpha/beta fold hydrolase [Novosphingobium sp. G106]